ncbi:MAG: PilZ domain-containing protein [Planctomycetota bacterium]
MNQRPGKRKADEAGRTNSLGVSRKQLKSLVQEIDRRSGVTQQGAGGRAGPANAPDRQYARWSYTIETVPAQLEHPGGSQVNLRLAARNLSAGGIALLHNGFVHTDTRVTIALALRDGTVMTVAGKVVRCSHVGGVVHELGVKFNNAIDLQTLKPQGADDWYTLERVDPQSLDGRLVLVGGSEMQRNAFRQTIKDSMLRVAEADTIDRAIEELGRGCDAIIADITGDPELAITLRCQLDTENIELPIIVIAKKNESSSQSAALALRPAAIIGVPLDEIVTLRALGEVLLVGRSSQRAAG